MAYVVRDGNGNVRAVFEDPVQGAEEVAPDDPALAEFVSKNAPVKAELDEWVQSDLSLSRVVEDLVDILIEKGVFMFTELPNGAQQILMARRGRRKEFAYMESLFGDMAMPLDEDGGGDGNDQGAW